MDEDAVQQFMDKRLLQPGTLVLTMHAVSYENAGRPGCLRELLVLLQSAQLAVSDMIDRKQFEGPDGGMRSADFADTYGASTSFVRIGWIAQEAA